MLYGLDDLRYARIVNPVLYTKATVYGAVQSRSDSNYVMHKTYGEDNRFRLFDPLQ
tara:strand:- start:113 stop:280 length:168 start_codon:yes stop_codon:yes gene_type:complete